MKEGDIIKGKDLALGMKVQRMANGIVTQHPMIIFEEGPYYRNPLYSNDDFLLVSEEAI